MPQFGIIVCTPFLGQKPTLLLTHFIYELTIGEVITDNKVTEEEVYFEPSEITAVGGWAKHPGKGFKELLMCTLWFAQVEGRATCVDSVPVRGSSPEESSSISHTFPFLTYRYRWNARMMTLTWNPFLPCGEIKYPFKVNGKHHNYCLGIAPRNILSGTELYCFPYYKKMCAYTSL